MQIEQNIKLFAGQMLCAGPVYTWRYDADLLLLETNCPDSSIYMEAFELFGCKKVLADHIRKCGRPIMLSSPVGLVWVAASYRQGDIAQQTVLLGPVLTTDADMHSMEQSLRVYSREKNISLAWQGQLSQALKTITVLQINLLQRYVLMLHYCLTSEILQLYDLQYEEIRPLTASARPALRDRHQTWMAEQALLRAVREGDMNYQTAFDTASSVSTGVTMPSADAIRRAKNSVIVFTSLCTRAAIEGGMTPDQAYALGDSYIQSVENSGTISEISSYSYTMYTDFVERVYKCRTNLDVSSQIRTACKYIEMRTEEAFTTADVAKRVGYAEYYLTQKFKAEMGVSITNYIKFARIERAKLLLTATDLSVQEIAVRLQFCARSYFSKVFTEIVGCTPVEYRSQNKKF